MNLKTAALCLPPRLRPPRLRPGLWKAHPLAPRTGGVSEGVSPGRARLRLQREGSLGRAWLEDMPTAGSMQSPLGCAGLARDTLLQTGMRPSAALTRVLVCLKAPRAADLLGQRSFQSCLFSYWPHDGFQESQPRSRLGVQRTEHCRRFPRRRSWDRAGREEGRAARVTIFSITSGSQSPTVPAF